MLEKILVPVVFIVTQLIINWYAWFSGNLPSKGTYLGIAYDSFFIRSFVTQLEYIWVLIIINVLFTFALHLGFTSYKNFLLIIVLWIASAPIAAFIFNAFVVKEKIDAPMLVGILLIVMGSVTVLGHKEIAKILVLR